jgi:hypothetical protein
MYSVKLWVFKMISSSMWIAPATKGHSAAMDSAQVERFGQCDDLIARVLWRLTEIAAQRRR